MDISFPASTMILSDMVSAKRQGAAASLVNTVVNYSVSIGLGIAGTVETCADKDGLHALQGYRAALWTSVALSGCTWITSLGFAGWMTWKETRWGRH